MASASIAHATQPANYVEVDQTELQSFEFFIRRVVPGFSTFADRHFWRQLIPQLSRSDRTIWDAVNALACLIQYPQFSRNWSLPGRKKSAVTNEDHCRALRWYSKSLGGLQERIRHGATWPGMLIVSCLLYICIECLQDNLDEAVGLAQQAMAMTGMLAQVDAGSESTTAAAQCVPSLGNAIQALLRHLSVLEGVRVLRRSNGSFPNTTFESLSDAREEGYVIISETHQFIIQILEMKLTVGKDWLPIKDLIDRRKDLKTRLLRWKAAIHNMVESRPRSVPESHDEDELYSALMLSYNHYFIWLSTCFGMYQTKFDRFIPSFRSIVDHARRVIAAPKERSQRPVFVLETRIIPSLYFVAISCRHPIIRRQAISLLEKEAPRMEYHLKAEPMAEVIKRIVGIEESGGSAPGMFCLDCPPDRIDALPAEDHRIYRHKLIEIPDPSSGEPVQFLTYGIWRQQGEGGAWISTEHMIKM